MKSIQATAAIMALATSSVAYADWQYTAWGMSAAEVSSASGGITQPLVFDPTSVDPMLKNHLAEIEAAAPTLHAPYQAGGRQYDAEFHFTNDRLDQVFLKLRYPADCLKLEGELLGGHTALQMSIMSILEVLGGGMFRRETMLHWQ